MPRNMITFIDVFHITIKKLKKHLKNSPCAILIHLRISTKLQIEALPHSTR